MENNIVFVIGFMCLVSSYIAWNTASFFGLLGGFFKTGTRIIAIALVFVAMLYFILGYESAVNPMYASVIPTLMPWLLGAIVAFSAIDCLLFTIVLMFQKPKE
jgi:hypothetical protein